MTPFDQLPPYIITALKQFESEYTSVLERSAAGDIRRTGELLSSAPGKRIRPLLLLLTATALGKIDSTIIDGAIFVELLHAATLIHDDVIDESDTRRGTPALHTIIGSHRAVLAGDYVLATSMQKAGSSRNPDVIEALGLLGQMLVEGELMQSDAAQGGVPTIEQYYSIIHKKTASLMSISVYIAATLSGADKAVRMQLAEAATQLGLAFQIKDDIFDYDRGAEVGKPTGGNDLKEHKVTLPLLLALKAAQGDERARMISLLDQPTLSPSEIDTLITFAHNHHGIELSAAKMQEHIEQAKALFSTYLPQNQSQKILLDLCDYIGNRTR